MAHHVYQTDTFVLGGTNVGEYNRFLDLFTRDLGLVRAVAKSLRKEKSKLRYSLQPYTYGKVALVRGKDVWRVTNAHEDYSTYYTLRDDPKKLALLYNISSLLRRLLQGEERNEYLFEALLAFATHLESDFDVEEDIKAIEYLTVLRILYSLGYIAKKDDFFDSQTYDANLLDKVRKEEKELLKEINHALTESHL